MKTIAAKLFLLFIFLCESLFAGASVKIGNLYYELDNSNKSASVTYLSNSSSSDKNYVSGVISIPSSVSYSGTTYSVTSIGYWAFMGCSGLRSIKCLATVPPLCGSAVFDGVDKSNCTLQVPEGCEAAYQSADQWKEFFFIEGVNDIRRIFGNDAVAVDVYTLDGALLRKGMDASQIATELPRGLYVINGRKVMVK